eukprot:scaffold3236_cov188-Ochromonas_danica.AAC.4
MGVLESSSSSRSSSSKSSGGSVRSKSSTSSSGESSSSNNDPSPAVPTQQVVNETIDSTEEEVEEKRQLENKESDENYYLDEDDNVVNDENNNATLSSKDHPLVSSEDNDNNKEGIENDSFLPPLASHDSPRSHHSSTTTIPKENILKSQEEQHEEDTLFQSFPTENSIEDHTMASPRSHTKENILKSHEEQHEEDTLFQSFPTENLINHPTTIDSSMKNEGLLGEGGNNNLDDLQENDWPSDWSMNPEKEDDHRPHFLFPYPLQDLPSEEWPLQREDASSDIYKPPKEENFDRQESQSLSSYHHEDSKEDKVISQDDTMQESDHILDRSVSDHYVTSKLDGQEGESSEQAPPRQGVLDDDNNAFLEGVDFDTIDKEIIPLNQEIENKTNLREIEINDGGYVNQSSKGDDKSQTDEQDVYYNQEEFDQGNTDELQVNSNDNNVDLIDDKSNLYNNFEDNQATLSQASRSSSSRKGDEAYHNQQLDSEKLINQTEPSVHSEGALSRNGNDSDYNNNNDNNNDNNNNNDNDNYDYNDNDNENDNVKDHNNRNDNDNDSDYNNDDDDNNGNVNDHNNGNDNDNDNDEKNSAHNEKERERIEKEETLSVADNVNDVKEHLSFLINSTDLEAAQDKNDEVNVTNSDGSNLETNFEEKEEPKHGDLLNDGPATIDSTSERFLSDSQSEEAKSSAVLEVNEYVFPRETNANTSTIGTTIGLTDIIPLDHHSGKSPIDKLGQLSEQLAESYVHSAVMEVRALSKRPPELLVDGEKLPILTSHDRESIDENDQLGEAVEFPSADIILSDGSTPVIHPLKLLDSDRYQQANERLPFFPSFHLKQPENSLKIDSDNQTPISQLGNMLRESPNEEHSNQASSPSSGNYESIGKGLDRMSDTNTSSISSTYLTNTNHTFYDKFVEDAIQEGVSNIYQLTVNSPVVTSDRTLLPFASMSQLDNIVSYKPNGGSDNHRLLPLNQQRLVKNKNGGLDLSYPEKDPTGIPQDELLLMLRTLKPHASSNDVKSLQSSNLTQIAEDEGGGESGYDIGHGIKQDESASSTSLKRMENTATRIVDTILARSTQQVITKASANAVAVAAGKQESIGTLSPPPEERVEEESEELAPEDFTISDDNTMHSEQGETTDVLKAADIDEMLPDSARSSGMEIVKATDFAVKEGEVSEDHISPEESGGLEQSENLTSTAQIEAETDGIEPLLKPTGDLSPTDENVLAQASITRNESNSVEPRGDEAAKEGELSSTSLVDPSTLMVGGNLDVASYASQGLLGGPLKDDTEEGMDGEVLAMLGDIEGEAMAEAQENEQSTKNEDNDENDDNDNDDDDGLLMMQGTLPSISVKSPSSFQLGNSSSQPKATADPSMVSSSDNGILGEESHFRFLDEVSGSTSSSHSEDVKFSNILSNFDRVKSSMIITTTPSGEKKMSFVTPKSQATTPNKLVTPNAHENKLFENEEDDVELKNKDDEAEAILADVLNPILDADENVLDENDDNIDRHILSMPDDLNEENMENALIGASMVEGNEEEDDHNADENDAESVVLTPSVLPAGSTANTIATSRPRTPPAGGSVNNKSLLTATSSPNRKQNTVTSSNFPAADWKCLEVFSHRPDEPHRLVESVQVSLKRGLVKSYTTIQDDLRHSYREAGSALLSHLEEIEKVFYATIQKVSFETKPPLPQILASPEIDTSIYIGESEKEELVKSLISLESNLADQVELLETNSRNIYDNVKQELSQWNVLDMPGRLEALFEGTATNELTRRRLSYFHISDVTDYLRSPLNTIMRWTSTYLSNHLTEDSQIALLKSSRNISLSLVQANDRIARRYYALYQAKIGVLESEELIEKAQTVLESHINGQFGRATDILEALCYPPYEEDPPEDAKVYRRLVLDKIRPNRRLPALPTDGSLFGADSKVSSSLSDDSSTAQDKFSSHKKSRKDKKIIDSKQRPATANGSFADDIAHPKVQRPHTAEGKADRSNGKDQAKQSSPAPGSPYRGTPYYLPDVPDDGTIWVHVKDSEKHHHPPYLPHEAGRQSKALRLLMKSPERIAYDISWSDKLCQGLDYQDNYDAIHALNKLAEARKQKQKQSKSILSAVEMHTALKKGLTKSSLFSRDIRSILKEENGLERDPLLYNMIRLPGVKPSKFALTKKMIRCYSFSPSKAMTFAEKAAKTKEDLRNFQARSKERLRGELKGRITPTKKMKASESESSFFNEEEVIMGSQYKRKPLVSEEKIKASEPFVARMRGEAMRARSPSMHPSTAGLPPLLEHLGTTKESDGESSSSPPRHIARELSFKKKTKESQDITSFSGPILWQGDVERDHQSQPGDLLVGLASAEELLTEKEGMNAQSQQQQKQQHDINIDSTINMEGESMENKESNENPIDTSSLIVDEQATAFGDMAINKDALQPSEEKKDVEFREKEANDAFTPLDESQTRSHLIKLFTEECGLVIDENCDILNTTPLQESLSTIFKSWEVGSSSSAAHTFSSSSRRPSVSGGGAALRKMTQMMRITHSISNSKITKMMERLAISPAILETEAQIEVLTLLIEKSLESSRLRDAGQLSALQLPEIPAAYDLATSTYNVRRPGYNPLANEHVHTSPLRVPSGPLIKLDVTDYLSDKHLLKDLEKELNEGHSSPKPFRTGYMDAKQRQARLLPPADDRPGQINKSFPSSNRSHLDQKLDGLLFSIKKWRKHLHNALFELYEIHVAELFCPIVFMIQQEVRYRSGRAMLRAKRSPALAAQSIEPIADQIRSLLDDEAFASAEPLLSYAEDDYFTKRSLAVARVFDQASQLADELAEENVSYARYLASLSHA